MEPEQTVSLSWFLSVDMYVLDAAGNLLDAAILALLTALRDGISLPAHVHFISHVLAKLPAVLEKQGVFEIDPSKADQRLKITHHPIALTFSLFDDFVQFNRLVKDLC